MIPYAKQFFLEVPTSLFQFPIPTHNILMFIRFKNVILENLQMLFLEKLSARLCMLFALSVNANILQASPALPRLLYAKIQPFALSFDE